MCMYSPISIIWTYLLAEYFNSNNITSTVWLCQGLDYIWNLKFIPLSNPTTVYDVYVAKVKGMLT